MASDAKPLTEREFDELMSDDDAIAHWPVLGPRLLATVRELREFSALQDKLLACYRVGRTPTGKTLDRMHELRERLKGARDE